MKTQNYFSVGNKLEPFTPKTYKGSKNKTEFPNFVALCELTQEELRKFLPGKLLNEGYTDVVVDDGYIYAKGKLPVLLTAHMDTVHEEPVKDYYEYVDENKNHILSSPQGIGGDDRCGIYMILEIIKTHKCSVLFCEDEEIGGVGSRKFCETELITELESLNYLIELDRRGSDDAVFYDCANDEFIKFICDNTGYKESWGSFSDISYLAPACKVAAVNLSCGYYSAHTTSEEVNVEEMLYTIEMVKKLLETESEQFEYIEGSWHDSWGGYTSGNRNYGYMDSWWDTEEICMYIEFLEDNKMKCDVVRDSDRNGCLVTFFLDHPTVCYNDILDYSFDYY